MIFRYIDEALSVSDTVTAVLSFLFVSLEDTAKTSPSVIMPFAGLLSVERGETFSIANGEPSRDTGSETSKTLRPHFTVYPSLVTSPDPSKRDAIFFSSGPAFSSDASLFFSSAALAAFSRILAFCFSMIEFCFSKK